MHFINVFGPWDIFLKKKYNQVKNKKEYIFFSMYLKMYIHISLKLIR